MLMVEPQRIFEARPARGHHVDLLPQQAKVVPHERAEPRSGETVGQLHQHEFGRHEWRRVRLRPSHHPGVMLIVPVNPRLEVIRVGEERIHYRERFAVP